MKYLDFRVYIDCLEFSRKINICELLTLDHLMLSQPCNVKASGLALKNEVTDCGMTLLYLEISLI